MLKYLILTLFNLQHKSDNIPAESDPNRHIDRDNVVNIDNQANLAKRWLFRNKQDNVVLPPGGYELIKEYDLSTLNEDDWNMGPSWGDYHPKFLNTYFDRTGETIETDTSGVMKIGVKNKPKTFVDDNDVQYGCITYEQYAADNLGDNWGGYYNETLHSAGTCYDWMNYPIVEDLSTLLLESFSLFLEVTLW